MSLDRSTARQSPRAAWDGAVVVKRFDTPERVLVFDQGRLELITVGGRAIGKGSYAPGWRWSRCAAGATSSRDTHMGVVLSGRVKLQLQDGSEIDLTPGDFFHVAAEFDEWVVGYRPCEILYLSGVETLIRRVEQSD